MFTILFKVTLLEDSFGISYGSVEVSAGRKGQEMVTSMATTEGRYSHAVSMISTCLEEVEEVCMWLVTSAAKANSVDSRLAMSLTMAL